MSAYDGLIAALRAASVSAYWILDYGNPLYDNNTAPHSPEGVAAFARFAAAACTHFAGDDIVWEVRWFLALVADLMMIPLQLYNEPNGPLWTPYPNASAYAVLALAVGAAMRASCPGATLVGPATFEIDPDYLAVVFAAGVLEYFDAVSVHPYRLDAPETALESYSKLATLIAKYAPRGRVLPILAGEWGYTTCSPICLGQRTSVDLQARYLARTWLVNTMAGVPISIWCVMSNVGLIVQSHASQVRLARRQ